MMFDSWPANPSHPAAWRPRLRRAVQISPHLQTHTTYDYVCNRTIVLCFAAQAMRFDYWKHLRAFSAGNRD